MKLLQHRSFMLFKGLAMLLCIALSFSSCKKDKENAPPPPPPSPVVGKWVGVTTYNGFPTSNLAFVIKDGGTMTVLNTAGQKIGDGDWQLNDVAFNASYTITTPALIKYNFIGTLENPTRISGAFGTGNSKVNGGFWYVTKQP